MILDILRNLSNSGGNGYKNYISFKKNLILASKKTLKTIKI